MTTATPTAPTLNKAYAIQQEGGQAYPALQADNYKPSKKSDKIQLCLSEDSFKLLSDNQIGAIGGMAGEAVTFGTEDFTVFIMPETIRWVVLARPALFGRNKETKRYQKLEKGVKLGGTGIVTASKLFLAAVVNDELLLTDDGEIQLVTFNLTSSKTALVGGLNDKDLGVARNGGHKTLTALNAGLEKHYGAKGWLTHLVSVELKAIVEVFASSVSKDSSMGIRFVLGEGARPLNEDGQKRCFDLATSDTFKALNADPYRLAQQQASAPTTVDPSDGSSLAESTKQANADFDAIPF